jgi:single-stranded DNA-binding protein
MMIDALVSGRICKGALQRTGGSGKPFVTAKVRAAVADGDALFVSVIAFAEAARTALLALSEGDAVSLAGALTPKVWTDAGGVSHASLDMVAQSVTTAYHVTRKRQAMIPPAGNAARPAMNGAEQARRLYGCDAGGVPDDDL